MSLRSTARARARARRPFHEPLEERRLFALDLGAPIVFADGVNTSSYAGGQFHTEARAFSYITGDGEFNFNQHATLEIDLSISSAGAVTGAPTATDLTFIEDVPSGPDVLLLTGQIQPASFVFDGAGNLQFIFTVTGGDWSATQFLNKDIGVILNLTGQGSPDPFSFAQDFESLKVAGVLGSLPKVVVEEPPASICGRVFNECDDDGCFEPWNGEYGIGGVKITLLDANGNIVGETLTAPDGTYQFSNLPPGTYTIVETQPTGYLDGKDIVGSAGGQLDGNDRIKSIVLGSGVHATGYNFAEFDPSSLSGYVYVDCNKNCVLDSLDGRLEGVKMTLLDSNNNVVATTYTDCDGFYYFGGLRPGSYTIVEQNPTGVIDGKEQVGRLGGRSGDTSTTSYITCIDVCCDVDGVCYNFGECATTVGRGQTAKTSYWYGRYGQKLLGALNAGLGDWLATNFPKIFANLAGKTNAQVAAEYCKKYPLSSCKLDTQLMALAFSVYATDKQLGGTAASAYGFKVTDAGVGAALYSVGSYGAAFGCSNYKTTTVLELLKRANACACNGVLWDTNSNGSISSTEQSQRNMATSLFTSINGAGGIS